MVEVTLKGNPVKLYGSQLAAGQEAPGFTAQKNDLSEYVFEGIAGKRVIFASVPSLDTAVCDMETRRFNDEAVKLPDVEIVTVSMDLPFAQKRWCGAAGVDKVTTVSDHAGASFGRQYGVLIEGGPLNRFLARAVFVVGPDNRLIYVEYVKEIGEQPDFEAIRAALK